MKKLTKKLVMLTVCGLSMGAVNAQTTWNIGTPTATDVTATLTGGTLTISGTGKMQDFASSTIPWSSVSNSITALVIQNGVTNIGNYAFYNCSGLTGTLTIPDSVTSIGNYAFYNCSGLTGTLTIPNSVTSIGNFAFHNCSSLDTIICMAISPPAAGSNLFYGVTALVLVPCSSMQAYMLSTGWSSGNLKGVGGPGIVAQGTCGSNLTWQIDCDNVLTISGSGAMNNYPIGGSSGPWNSYTSAIRTVVIGDSVTSIGDNAFYNCSNLTFLIIGNSVKSIGQWAFRHAEALTTITIPDSVTTIGDGAFSSITSLQTVNFNAINCALTYSVFQDDVINIFNIGSAVKFISDNIFNGSIALTSINVDATNTAYVSENGILFNKSKTTIIRYLRATTDADTNYTIPSSVITIGNYAFYFCSGLTGITIPNNVTSIGDYAFSYCSGLTGTLTIPNGVTSIGSYAFYSCSGLTGTLTIPNSVTSIGNRAFSYCSGLTGITIPNGVTSIGSYAFSGCSGLTGITIPNGVTSIGSDAFSYCSKLNSVTIGNSVDNIGDYAFYNCVGLNAITTHAKIPPILGTKVFYNVSTVIPVYIPCEGYYTYRTANGWSSFTNFISGMPTEDTTFYNAAICYGVSYSDNNFSNLTVAGDYQIVLQNSNGCKDSVVILNLDVIIPLKQELCMISVDENNHNEIVWKVAEKVVSYNIYREGNTSGQYGLVANIDYNSQNKWIDTVSDAKIRSYRYKVSGIDTCGNESTLSDAHKTMHLTINAGQNNSWNLIWTAYEGTQYSTYNIYRSSGKNPGSWTLIGTMPSGNTSYSDFSAPNGNFVYYMVEIMLDEPCVLTKNLSSIKSNIATNNPNGVGIKQLTINNEQLTIYPNPTTGQLRVSGDILDGKDIQIFDIVGQVVFTSQLSKLSPETTIDISHLSAGLYFLKIDGKMFKVVKE